MSGRLGERIALVTGGARGIGRAISTSLAAAGATVVLTSRDATAAEKAATDIASATGVEVTGLAADLVDAGTAAALVRAVFDRHKRLDILVNNAGVMTEGMLGMLDPAAIDEQLALNARAPLLVLQAASRLLRRSGGGSVINIGSIVGEVGLSGYAVYSMSKAAVSALTRSAAQELGPAKIRVNCVVPGMIDTELIAHLDADTKQQRLAAIPLGRFGTAEEVAEVVTFLASDEARYVTGQVLGIDGGLRL